MKLAKAKGQLISKQNCQAITSSKKKTKRTQDETHSDLECVSFAFWKKLWLDNFVSRSTDL